MSINFHANQYEQAFDPKRLQNWEVPGKPGRFANRKVGFSQIRASDRGHLLPGIPKSRVSPWGTFVGTWDLPLKLPGNRQTNPTARSEAALLKLRGAKDEADEVLKGQLKKFQVPEPLPIKLEEENKSSNNVPQSPGQTPPVATQRPPSVDAYPVDSGHQLKWPYQGGGSTPPACKSASPLPADQPAAASPVSKPPSRCPADAAPSPKPAASVPHTAGGVQQDARPTASQEQYERLGSRKEVATPGELPLHHVNSTLQWPMARSAEAPVEM